MGDLCIDQRVLRIGIQQRERPGSSRAVPCCTALDYLPQHTTIDLSLGRNFGDNLSASITGLNIANRRVMLDDSLTFGGFHFNNPREILSNCATVFTIEDRGGCRRYGWTRWC